MSVGNQRLRYILRRLFQAIPVILAIIILCFLLLKLAPGDAAEVLAGEAGSASPEYMAQLRQRFGLDRPLHTQLIAYIKNIVTFIFTFTLKRSDYMGTIATKN